MKQNLLRAGFALILLSAILPATAGAHSGDGSNTTSSRRRAERPCRAAWSAGPVHRWTGYSRPGGSHRVRELQRRAEPTRLRVRSGRRTVRTDHRACDEALSGPQRPARRRNRRPSDAAELRAARGTPAGGAPDAACEPTQTRGRHEPENHPPEIVPERVAPEVHVRAPETPGPELPVVGVLVAIVLLGVATFVASYLRTDARIRQMRGDPPRRLPWIGAAPRHEGGGG